MLAGRTIAVRKMEELPPEAARDREVYGHFGIKSVVAVPLSVGGKSPVGILGFNTTRAEREWPDALVNRLQLVAQIFTNALARKRADQALRESEERLSLTAASAEAGLWVLDCRTHVFWATEKSRAIFGYSPDEVISMDRFEASVHPDDWDLVRSGIERSAQAGEPVNVEYRIRRADGRERWIASRGRPHFNSVGGPERVMGVSIDITERKRAEEAYRASEARLAAGAELAGLGYYEVDFGAPASFVDDRFHDICGVPAGQQPGLRSLEFWMEHLHPDDRPRVMEERQKLHEGRVERLSIEYRYLHPAEGQKWIHHLARVATRDATGGVTRTFGVIRDITAGKRAQDALRDLSGRLISAQEEERARLARELHDDITQRLARLAIDVGRCELGTAGIPPAETAREVREGLVRLSEDVHALAYRLHPAVLEDLGLAEALKAEGERFAGRQSIPVHVKLQRIPEPVPREAALCVFRIAQEALRNAARHAQARAVELSLREVDGGLQLAVQDDGCGFDPALERDRPSLGLASMRERVHLLGGELDIDSAPRRGTTIVAWVPLKKGSA
jgi:PAS domain S-box-containing protein